MPGQGGRGWKLVTPKYRYRSYTAYNQFRVDRDKGNERRTRRPPKKIQQQTLQTFLSFSFFFSILVRNFHRNLSLFVVFSSKTEEEENQTQMERRKIDIRRGKGRIEKKNRFSPSSRGNVTIKGVAREGDR